MIWGGEVEELRDVVGQTSSDALLASAAPATTLRLWLPQSPSDNALTITERPALNRH